MPRKGKGGARDGKPGGGYTNRSDLVQAPRAATGQTYGEAGRQIAAQKAVPLPAAAPTPTPGAAATSPGPTSPRGPSPIDVLAAMPGLMDPSMRPNEPVTAGLPIGPGQSPPPTSGDPTEGLLRRMVANGATSPIIFQLLAEAEAAAPRNAMRPGPGQIR